MLIRYLDSTWVHLDLLLRSVLHKQELESILICDRIGFKPYRQLRDRLCLLFSLTQNATAWPSWGADGGHGSDAWRICG